MYARIKLRKDSVVVLCVRQGVRYVPKDKVKEKLFRRNRNELSVTTRQYTRAFA